MKKNRVIILLLVLIVLPAMRALAAETADATRDVRLEVLFQDDGIGLPGAQFDIYRIADVDSTGELTVIPPFDRYNVNFGGQSESDLAGIAATLEGYILRDKIESLAMRTTDSDGSALFSGSGNGMEQGVYLIRGECFAVNGVTYTVQPSIVQLPLWDAANERWIYDVIINAKYESQPEAPETVTVTRKVLKVWEGEGYENALPNEIVVQLLQDGEVYDTVTLNAENLWRHTWQELASNHHWTVVEQEVDDFSVVIEQQGITFVVTNTYDPDEPTPTPTPSPTPPPHEPSLPQTGQLWWPVPMMTSAGLLLIVIGLLRRRRV